MCRRGQFLASRGSRRGLVRDEFADAESSRPRTVCGQFVSAANPCFRTVATAMRSRMRTVCDLDSGRGLSADMDCSRTRIGCVCGLFRDFSCSRICRVRGHERSISRGHIKYAPRLIRGHRNLSQLRSRACLVLNMVGNTLPPLLLQLVSPVFQLRHDRREASDLLEALRFDTCGVIVAQSRVRELRHGVRGVILHASFELLQNFDGSAQLGCCRGLHGQTWMPCECWPVGVRRCRSFR